MDTFENASPPHEQPEKFSPSAGNVVKLKCALNISFVVPVLVFIHALPAEYSLIRRLHE